MANEKILMLTMAVSNMAKSKTFYVEQLGWSVTTDVGQGDQHWVTVQPSGGGTAVTLTTMHGNMKPGTMHLYLSTPDIEATHNEYKARGLQASAVRDDLYGPGSGVKWFPLKDPDGNVWQVTQSEVPPS
jgi:predicted enzyme related to lactoylglutathione lyase